MNQKKDEPPPIASNRQAGHFYELLETFEAGLVLTGTEVKSLREGKCQLPDGFARFEGNELFLYNAHIGAYERGNIYNHEPTRPRKLLLHRNQLNRVFGLLTQKGLTIVPLKMYFKHGIVKCLIAVAKARKLHDRRTDIKNKMVEREMGQAMKVRRRKAE